MIDLSLGGRTMELLPDQKRLVRTALELLAGHRPRGSTTDPLPAAVLVESRPGSGSTLVEQEASCTLVELELDCSVQQREASYSISRVIAGLRDRLADAAGADRSAGLDIVECVTIFEKSRPRVNDWFVAAAQDDAAKSAAPLDRTTLPRIVGLTSTSIRVERLSLRFEDVLQDSSNRRLGQDASVRR